MSVVVLIGSKHKIFKELKELKNKRVLFITCETSAFISNDFKFKFIFLDISNFDTIFSKIANYDFDVIIVEVYEIIKNYLDHKYMTRRIIEKLLIRLYSLCRAKNIEIFLVNPLNSLTKKPLIDLPNVIPLLRVRHL